MSQAPLDLLRPPAHRGPLIAAGAVVLTVGVVLAELRLGDAVGVVVHALITGVPAALILGIGLQAVGQGGRPPAYQSVLIVTGLLLLEVFLRHPRQVLERTAIFETVWGYDFGATSNALAVYVGYLRRKTEAGGEPRLLHTVRGVGYVLKDG